MKLTTIIIGLMAVCTVVGVVIGQSTATHTAEVRINARQLDDGRVEFALQQRLGNSWGERTLLPGRFLPADVGHDRWVSSRPFTVSIEVPLPEPSEDMLEEENPTAQSTSADDPKAAALAVLAHMESLVDPTTLPLVPLTVAGETTTHSIDTGWHVIAVKAHGTNAAGAPITFDHHYACMPDSGVLHQWHEEHGWSEIHHPDVDVQHVKLWVMTFLPQSAWDDITRVLTICAVSLNLPGVGVEEQPATVVSSVIGMQLIEGHASHSSYRRAELFLRCQTNPADWYLKVYAFSVLHRGPGDEVTLQQPLDPDAFPVLVQAERHAHQWHFDHNFAFAVGLDAKYFWEQALAQGELTLELPAQHGGTNLVTIDLLPILPGDHRPCG